MKNWKTTLAGIGSALILVIITFLVKHTIDPETLTVAIGLGTVGFVASDASTVIQTIAGTAGELPFLQNRTAKEIIGLGDSVLDMTSASHPTNVLLSDIKTGLDTLNQSINTVTPAAAVNITNTNEAPAAAVVTEPTELEKAQAKLQEAQDAVNALTAVPLATTGKVAA